jgi:spore coat polysaccharide biosynthesis predicted glycosyltransferase SpsG
MLTSAARDMPAVQVVQNVSDMPQRMAWADVAIAAGGSTNWELAFMGLPTMTIILAENQSPIAEHLHRRGVVHNLGWYSGLTPTTIAHTLEALLPDAARRGEMARRGRELVDGEGGRRVARTMMKATGAGA